MTNLILTGLGCLFLVLGSIFVLLASLGILRLPDVYTRMHAASKAGAVGGGLILLAVAVLSSDSAVTLRAIIGVAFLLLTTPLSAHLLARASYRSGDTPVTNLVIDDLKSK